MREIHAYVDSVYAGTGGKGKEIEELKEEMKRHLIDAVHELKLTGKSEQEAAASAIERFGGEKELRSIVWQLFGAQRLFAKWVLYGALAFLLICSVATGTYWTYEVNNGKENKAIAATIQSLLAGESTISEEAETEISQLVGATEQLSLVRIFKMSDVRQSAGSDGDIVMQYRPDMAQPAYAYERAIWDEEWKDFYYAFNDSEWFIHLKARQYSTAFDVVFIGGLSAYWVLFAIWAMVNAYHQRRLTPGWAAAFILGNVLGYAVFQLAWSVERRRGAIA
ncbi:permease prefix domain 1-containing protein [Paenibacillus sp. J5C_2022]|uniref:permease prefix domain 1-containing protein n=1 Tax=Paenibacillus sp. J5C2022 TaxID=2977129 RepID=UPI0021D27B83|nr:permease prefix domain 1-containing protein [Paenibacillus sp. J5C2022]MCU6713098.1 permease prefix domain 1-containing protein [Paenibacillus sp. J5C2022]